MLLTHHKRLRELAGVLETANPLLLRLAVRDRRAARSFPGRVFREYMNLAGHGRWRSQPLEEVFPEFAGTRITIEHLPGEGIATPLDELAHLALLTRIVQPRRVFEIGTFRGRTALNFALNSPPGSRIFTLDLPADSAAEAFNAADRRLAEAAAPGADCRGKDGAEKIEQLYGDSQTFDFSPYHGTIDLVFVDGAHHYSAARKDTETALRLIRPGGVIVWHDFANYGDYNDVTRAVLDVLPGERVIQLGSTQLALHRD